MKKLNHNSFPLISVVLATHEGDVSLVHRAIHSIANQTLPTDLIEIIIAFDGEPSKFAMKTLEQATEGLKNQIQLIYTKEKTGYYTVPRNRAIPLCRGAYIANLDADNEWLPEHLEGLLTAIRTQQEARGCPDFVYSRRMYVKDPEALNHEGHEKLPEGPSELVEWNAENVVKLVASPQMNFVDTSDFLISRGAMFQLANLTHCPWNPDTRRYGDWELIRRMAQIGLWGKEVDQVTQIYHWTGDNLQTNRFLSDVMAIPESVYEKLVDEGVIVNDRANQEKQ